MRGPPPLCQHAVVTTLPTGPAPAPDLPPAWWAPGLSLRERLAAPSVPDATPSDAPAGRPALAARLTGPGTTPAQAATLAAALAAEPADRLAARAPQPAWASFVAEALAGVPAGTGPAERAGAGSGSGNGPDGDALLAPIFAPLVDAAVAGLRAACGPGADTEVVARELAAWLRRRLVRLGARTLAEDLAAERAAGRLAGDGPGERFEDFVRRTATRAGLARLSAAYPVLARLLAQTCLHAAEARAELLTRWRADRDRVVAGLLGGTHPGPLVGLEVGGDRHQRGRAVAVLRFAGGTRVVYKPRPTGQHAVLAGLTDWLNGRLPGLGLRTPATVHADGYGWQEFVDHRPCSSPADLDRFYRRLGALLALLHAARATDLHYDNLVAHGDQPVLVDVETLFHPCVTEPAAAPDPASDALGESVYRTCLLPQLMIGESDALDISGIGGGLPGGPVPGARGGWADPGTDTMRPVPYRRPSAAGRNRPLLDGRRVQPADYRAALLDGFRAAYDAVTADRAALAGPDGPLAAAGEVPGRLVIRPSQDYALVLDGTTAPELLRDGLDRDAALAVPAAGPLHERLAEDEIADLWDGDLPVFHHRPGAADVWTSRGVRRAGALPGAALDGARAALLTAGEVDRYDQEWIITAALAGSRPALLPAHTGAAGRGRSPAAAAADPQVLLAAACAVADEIVARSLRGGGRANWIGLELVADTYWTVLPMGAGLAQGYLGVALFLGQLGALTGSARYTGLAREALAPVPGLVAALAADPELSRAVGPGGFEGLGGICLALARLDTLVPDAVAGCLPAALTALEHALADDDALALPLDLSAGLAGTLAAAHAVHRERGLPQAALLADRAAGLLLARLGSGGAVDGGFARGGAGDGFPRGGAEVGGAGGLLSPGLGSGDPADGGFARGGAGVGDRAAGLPPPRLGSQPGSGHLADGLAEHGSTRAGGGFADPLAGRPGAEPGSGDPADGLAEDGFARGRAGVGWALLRHAARRPGAPDAAECAAQGRRLLETALANAAGDDPGWCAGLAGLALGAADGLGGGAGALPGLDGIARRLGAALPAADLSLCHGYLGVLEALAVLADHGHEDAKAVLAVRTGQALSAHQAYGPGCGTPDSVPTPGLLSGLSGIGYGLIRRAFPDQVPSVLLLDAGP